MNESSGTGEGTLLEEIRSQLKVVAEGHTTLDQKMDRVAHELHQAIDGVGEKSEWLLQRMNHLDGRIGQLDGRMGRVEAAALSLLGEVRTLSDETKGGFADVLKAIGELGTKLDLHARSHA